MTVEITGIIPKKHCYRCGQLCVAQKYLSHFDSTTGKPIFFTKVFCPSFWLFRHVFGHLKEEYDEKGRRLEYYGY